MTTAIGRGQQEAVRPGEGGGGRRKKEKRGRSHGGSGKRLIWEWEDSRKEGKKQGERERGRIGKEKLYAETCHHGCYFGSVCARERRRRRRLECRDPFATSAFLHIVAGAVSLRFGRARAALLSPASACFTRRTHTWYSPTFILYCFSLVVVVGLWDRCSLHSHACIRLYRCVCVCVPPFPPLHHTHLYTWKSGKS